MAKRKPDKKKAKAKESWLKPVIKWSLVLMALLLVYLDIQVISQFEGRKWALPAHVYARSLEIYQGMKLSADELQWELRALGYQPVQAATVPGYFSRNRNRIHIYTREFSFWDGVEPAQAVSLTFSGGSVTNMRSLEDNRELSLVRLEPLRIGGIYPSHWEDREVVRLGEIPHYLADALVAVEDRDFYQHWGISPRGIARAIKHNIQNKRLVEGGSTITQQLVKNFYLDSERTLRRKLTEAVMSLLLDLHYSKREILETYINEVYLGQAGKRGIHGYGLASRHYFRKPLAELELHQVALLVAVGKGASYYNPWKHPVRTKQRRDVVLDVLAREGVVTRAQAHAAKEKSLDVIAQPSFSYNDYPAYLDLVKRQLKEDYDEEDLNSEGLRVFTNLDPQVQRKLEQSIESQLSRIEKGYQLERNSLQSAAVVVRVGAAEVIAVAGDRQPRFAGFNRALDARRQIGSTIKPAVYLTALEQPSHYTLATLISDEALSVPTDEGEFWSPRNFAEKSHGEVPLYQALGHSYNQATARLGMELGLDNVTRTIKRLGHEGDIPRVPSMLLGSMAMSPFAVANLYHTIAAEGFYTPLRTIREVYDADNQPLKRYLYKVEQRFSQEAIHLTQYALQVVLREGTGKSAYNYLPKELSLAGKTGTTNDQRDSWFSGFSGNTLAVTWVGRDDNGRMPITGATGALQLWAQMMSKIDNQPLVFAKPERVVYKWVEPQNQVLSSKNCVGARYLPFVEGSEPRHKGTCVRRARRSISDWLRDTIEWISR